MGIFCRGCVKDLDISLNYILKYEKGCMIMHAWLLKSVVRAP